MSSLLRFSRLPGAPIAAIFHLAALDVVFAAIAVLLVACYALTGSYG